MLSRGSLMLAGYMLVCLLNTSSCLDDASKKMMQAVDPTPIIANKKMVESFMACFFDTGPCNVISAQIKKNIGEVMETGCATCEEEQLILMKSVLEAFIPRYPDQWEKFLAKYDPEGKHWPGLKTKLDINM